MTLAQKNIIHHQPVFQFSQPQIYGAIDLGTNNCRLLVARAQNNDVRVIDSYSKIVRLGEKLSETKNLNENAVERTLQALKVCAQKLAQNGIHGYRAVTTAACRSAENSDEFIKKIQSEIGLNLEIISPKEEARLSASACANLMDMSKDYCLVFDIGGGSTEFCWIKHIDKSKSELVDFISIPFGVSSLTEAHQGQIIPDNVIKNIQNMIAGFSQRNQIPNHYKNGNVQTIGNSGTVTALAAVNLKLSAYERSKVDGYNFPATEIMQTSEHICSLSIPDRVDTTCIGEDRADFMAAGCGILKSICTLWDMDQIRVADRGLREGILYDFLLGQEVA